MFERFLAFLKELGGEQSPGHGLSTSHPAVSAAALLFHVMDADGVRAESERTILEKEIAENYGVEGQTLQDILAAGEAAEQEAVDLYGFTSVLNQSLAHEAKVAFIGMMWEIVYADNVRSELEDNVVWRVAELLHVERADRIRMRKAVEGQRGGTAGRVDEVDPD